MNYTDFMTNDEAAVLAAVLLDGGKDRDLMAEYAEYEFTSSVALDIAIAIDALDFEDKTIDVISVFEQSERMEDVEKAPIALLNSICQAIQPRAKTMAILRGVA